MKINGITLSGPAIKTLVIPRDSGNIVFRAKAILDFAPYEALYKRPDAPFILMRGETSPSLNFKDPKYIEAINTWSRHRTEWLIMESLSATEGLEFETVKMDDVSTWGNVITELTSAGFTPPEVNRIVDMVFEVNALNQDSIDKATRDFLAKQSQAQSAQ